MPIWLFVFLTLYIPPLMVILMWRNFRKRRYIYGSVYIILATIMIITVLNLATKSESVQMNQKKVQIEKDIEDIKEDKEHVEVVVIEEDKDIYTEEKKEDKSEEIQEKEEIEIVEEINQVVSKTQTEIFEEFYEKLKEIDKRGLDELKKAYSVVEDIKNSKLNLRHLYNIGKKAKMECEIIEIELKKLKVPDSLDKDIREILISAKNDLQIAYYLRGKALENGLKLLDGKNPKYMIKLQQLFRSSDEYVVKCREKINKAKEMLRD
ncbi:hypothetical protein SAMN05661008_01150 [Alkalithermobacter thermoalcaliphilus JW-YL-7 = DSM 7308]|uniref:Uncharacterized protein n=1 Tax=Alkalithermobacter thermoalcaliphilus JW-YL-7 = DSM 7308 TaxID=1121328 RepID=A0A150FNH1_CLOPD|nr:hypothetical protein JWYL7_0236 [[Clostridium] paradoxum JW-YL-7 = DSM 7308]SHK92539.1 hypothetical protein SAMN05661008_01150 [[Clostridium] paradoxum JW-YL-7 = DSM 7308]